MDNIIVIFVFIFIFIFVITSVATASNNKDKTDNSKKLPSIFRRNLNDIGKEHRTETSDYSNINLRHTDCDNKIDENCIHVYDLMGEDEYNRRCKNCGHMNSKKAKRCTVCGKRIKL